MATNNKNFRVKNGLDVNGEINASAVGGDEGGQINLQKPATGTTLSGNVSIDIYQNKIRIFDSGGTARGAYIDLSAAAEGVGSNLLLGGGSGIANVVEDTTPQLGGDLDAQGYDITNLNSLTFDTTPTSPGTAAGTIYWDDGDGVPKTILNANVTVGVNQELILKVKNATGTTITKGSVVYINGAQGQNPTIALANATTEGTSSKTFGFTAEAIIDGAEGFLIAEGIFRGANTDGLVEGDPIYLSTTAGQYTQTIPAEPAHSVFLGYVVKAHASAGEIIVKIQNGYELTELHGVTIANTAATNDILQLNSSGIWVNANLATAGIANLSGAIFTGNVAGTNLALSGKDIFSNTGTGAPTFTTYSSGVRTVFYDNIGGTSVGYSRGIDAGVLWDSIPAADAGMFFKWYGGETQVASLSGTGVFTATTIVGNTNASTITTGTIDNARTTAASANGASTIVARNSTGNFTANLITSNLVSNSVTINDSFGNTLLGTGGGIMGITFDKGIRANTVTITQAERQSAIDAFSYPISGQYFSSNNTYQINVAAGNYFTNITTQRLYNSSSGWTIVGTNTSSMGSPGSTSLTHLLSSPLPAEGDVVIVIATADSATNATPTTSSSGWTTNAAAATTYGSAVFWKTMGATPDETIAINYGSTDIVAVASIVVRSSDILPIYVTAIATPTRANATSGVPTPPATTTTIANTLVVTVGSLRNDVVSASASTGPAGYSNYTLANVGSIAGTAAASMLATKFVATIGTETPTAFAPKFANTVAVSDYSSAWTFQIAAYLDPTITITGTSFLTSGGYPASTYVLHINNPSAAAAATITWSGATFAWQGGTAPTLSTIAPNNIVILETINGSTFRGALLDSYA